MGFAGGPSQGRLGDGVDQARPEERRRVAVSERHPRAEEHSPPRPIHPGRTRGATARGAAGIRGFPAERLLDLLDLLRPSTLGHENLNRHAEVFRFTKLIIAFRRRHQIVRRWRYLTADESETPLLRNITWHGVTPNQADFSGSSRFIAWELEAFQTDQRTDVPIYVASNAFWEPLTIELPEIAGRRWYRVVDTSLPQGEDIVPEEQAFFLPDITYEVRPRSTIVLVSR